MKDDPEIIRLVCRPHCRYYRPGAKEEMTCRGYKFWKEVLAGGRPGEVLRLPNARELLPLLERLALSSPPQPPFPHNDRIENRLCGACPFRPADCDFQTPGQAGAVPCGGYVLLARLLTEEEGGNETG